MLIIDKPYKIKEERKHTRVSEIKEYARKKMRHIRTGIKDEFKEEHYNALIYKICELLDELENNK